MPLEHHKIQGAEDLHVVMMLNVLLAERLPGIGQHKQRHPKENMSSSSNYLGCVLINKVDCLYQDSLDVTKMWRLVVQYSGADYLAEGQPLH